MTKDQRARRAARIAAGTWPACSVDGCEKPKDKGGLCAMHRGRLRRHGSVDIARGYQQVGDWDRGLLQQYIEGEGGCWLWTGPISPQGYGRIHQRNPQGVLGAHRASYLHHHGPIPEGLYVCHSCDVRACINPAHLWVGTHQANMDDMAAKKRGRRPQTRHYP